mmetsp:Transcript_30150/g.59154  ORF Transcript_30150/g.59154 Transcript_30150/m.59154 type:complete len:97 (-) Transcript_30150:579-869(-)
MEQVVSETAAATAAVAAALLAPRLSGDSNLRATSKRLGSANAATTLTRPLYINGVVGFGAAFLQALHQVLFAGLVLRAVRLQLVFNVALHQFQCVA